MGVISYGIVYTPWYHTPDHGRPTPGLLYFACVVWLYVGFGALYSALMSYDAFTLLGFAVLVLPAYRTLRSAVGAPAAMRLV